VKALSAFSNKPQHFGPWFLEQLKRYPLPWDWDGEDAAWLLAHLQATGASQGFRAKASKRDQAAALATSLALGQDAFLDSGDSLALFEPLAKYFSIQPGRFGTGLARLAKCLEPSVSWTCDQNDPQNLINVLPFLRLMGMTTASMTRIARHWANSPNPLPKRLETLAELRWENAEHRQSLRRALNQHSSEKLPGFLGEEAELLLSLLPEEGCKSASIPWLPAVLQTPGECLFLLLPQFPLMAGTYRGNLPQEYQGEVVQEWGIPQNIQSPARVERKTTHGWELLHQEDESILEPTFFGWAKELPSGTLYSLLSTQSRGIWYLPPNWTNVEEIQGPWLEGSASQAFLDPDGNLQGRIRAKANTKETGITLVEKPKLQVVTEIPKDLPDLVITPGPLGSSLSEPNWRPGDSAIPPLGHLVLSWQIKGGRHRKQVFHLPPLDCSTRANRVHLRGMPGLYNKAREPMEKAKFYTLPSKDVALSNDRHLSFELVYQPSFLTRLVTLSVRLPIPFGGARFVGSQDLDTGRTHSPFFLSLDQLNHGNLENCSWRILLPNDRPATLKLEGVHSLSDKEFKDKSQLKASLLYDYLKPLARIFPPNERPFRLVLAQEAEWGKLPPPPTLLFRLYMRNPDFRLRLERGILSCKPLSPAIQAALEETRVLIGSVTQPLPPLSCRLGDLHRVPSSLEGFTSFQLPRQLPSGPLFLQLRHPEGQMLPLSLTMNEERSAYANPLEAFRRAADERRLFAPSEHTWQDLRDETEQLIDQIAWRWLERRETFQSEEAHWLGFLEDDFQFSQPWTCAIALADPCLLMQRLLHSQARQALLHRLASSSWNWWHLLPQHQEALGAPAWRILSTDLEELGAKHLAELRHLLQSQRDCLLQTILQRLVECGFLLVLPPKLRQELLETMRFRPLPLANLHELSSFHPQQFIAWGLPGLLLYQHAIEDAALPPPCDEQSSYHENPAVDRLCQWAQHLARLRRKHAPLILDRDFRKHGRHVLRHWGVALYALLQVCQGENS